MMKQSILAATALLVAGCVSSGSVKEPMASSEAAAPIWTPPDPSIYILRPQPAYTPPSAPATDDSYAQHYLGHPFNGAPGYGDVGGYAGHVSGGPDVYVIPRGAGQ